MDIRKITPDFAVAPQLKLRDVEDVAARGFKSILIIRPDGEATDQVSHSRIISEAKLHGLDIQYIPVLSGWIEETDIEQFREAAAQLPGPILAYCASGARSASLWALAQAGYMSPDAIFDAAGAAGYDLMGIRSRVSSIEQNDSRRGNATVKHTVLIVGGGAAGIATAASLRTRQKDLDIAIIEPSPDHYYQPGFTLVGGGIFHPREVIAKTERLIPSRVKWIRAGVSGFEPEINTVVLEDGERIEYKSLVIAAGLQIDLDAIPGLQAALGQNGVTTNYLADHASYTNQLAKTLMSGRAIFTQPKGPFKCAGAPQKAMYLTCDTWRKRGTLKDIEVSFHTPGAALFGIDAYVPALRSAVTRYGIDPHFQEELVDVDGARRVATFETRDEEHGVRRVERAFDMLHVVPPQCAMKFIAASPLANNDGWVDVDQETLQHKYYPNVFAVGDCAGTPNAKTAAAARKQAPVVAANLLEALKGRPANYAYNGYGSCPLIVSHGKALLAEFSYGGQLDPSFPNWLVDGRKPSRFAWWLKTKFMRSIYYHLMLKGREWLAKPRRLRRASDVPTPAPETEQRAA